MRGVHVALVLLAGVLIGCGTGNDPTEVEPVGAPVLDEAVAAEVRAEVEALADAYVDHLSSSRWREVLGLYSEDERFYWVEGGQRTYGSRQEMGDQMARVYPMVRTNEFVASNRRVTPLDEDRAALTMDFEQRLELTSGQQIALGGTMTGLAVREAEGWKLLLGHTTTMNLDQP